jgi:hypothetical protein
MPPGHLGTPYSLKPPITGGSPPYTVALNGDQEVMPPGLQLASDGTVSGTPTAPGTYYINIKVFDQRYPPALGPAAVFQLTFNLQAALPTPPATATSATPRPQTKPPWWKNCTQLLKRYPHGVGRLHAIDKTHGAPVTNFKRSNALYQLTVRHNPTLDRDKDGIACERR